jgi:hypothetical protein
MNFLDIAQKISDAQDGDTITTLEGSNLSQDVRRIKEHINQAYNVVKLALGIRNENAEATSSITTVAGQESYSFPTGILTIQQLKFENDFPLKLLPWPEFEREKSDYLYDYVPFNSCPYAVAIYQRKVWMYPIPDGAYTISVRGLETLVELELDTDEPDLPREFHRVIKELALYYEMAYENNPKAGELILDGGGNMTGMGGQAATAAGMFNIVKKTFRQHSEIPPRMRSIHEINRTDIYRRWYK